MYLKHTPQILPVFLPAIKCPAGNLFRKPAKQNLKKEFKNVLPALHSSFYGGSVRNMVPRSE